MAFKFTLLIGPHALRFLVAEAANDNRVFLHESPGLSPHYFLRETTHEGATRWACEIVIRQVSSSVVHTTLVKTVIQILRLLVDLRVHSHISKSCRNLVEDFAVGLFALYFRDPRLHHRNDGRR